VLIFPSLHNPKHAPAEQQRASSVNIPPLATSRTWASAQAQEVAFSPAKGGDNAGIGLAANRRHWRVAEATAQRALSPPIAGEKASTAISPPIADVGGLQKRWRGAHLPPLRGASGRFAEGEFVVPAARRKASERQGAAE